MKKIFFILGLLFLSIGNVNAFFGDGTVKTTLTIDNSLVNVDNTNSTRLITEDSINQTMFSLCGDGQDIYFTNPADNKTLSRDIIFWNNVTNTTQINLNTESESSSTNTTYHIYCNGSSFNNNFTTYSSDILGFWTFSETSGDLIDRTGRGNNGTITNAVNNQSGKWGRSYFFDGAGDYVTISDNWAEISADSLMTLEVWVKPFIRASNAWFSTWNGGGDVGFGMQQTASGTGFLFNTAGAGLGISPDGIIANDTWGYEVSTYDKITIRNYDEGISVSNTSSTNALLFNSINQTRIGDQVDGAQPFHGYMQQIVLTNRTKTQAEIQTDYNNQNNPELFWTAGEIQFGTDLIFVENSSSIVFEAQETNITLSVNILNNTGTIDNVLIVNFTYNHNSVNTFNFTSDSSVWINATQTVFNDLQVTNNTNSTFNWTYQTTFVNGTKVNTTSTTLNQTIYFGFFFQNVSLVSPVLENTMDVNFSSNVVNLSSIVLTNISVDHEWNGTNTTASGNYFTLLTIPEVSSDTNVTYKVYANITYNGITRNRNNTFQNQTIQEINVFHNDTCETYALNVSSIYELDALTNATSVLTDFEFLFKGLKTENVFGVSIPNSSNFSICITPNNANTTFNASIDYDNATTEQRKHFLFNFSLSNATQNLSLYSLESVITSNITFTLKDLNGNLLDDHFITAQKRYLSNDTFLDVAMCKTNFEGKCTMPLQLFRDYIFVIRTVDKIVFVTSGTTIALPTLIITVSPISEIPFFSFTSNFTSVIGVDNTTNITTATFVNLRGVNSIFNFKVLQKSLLGDTLICDINSTGSSVSIQCPLGATVLGTNYDATGYVYISNAKHFLTKRIISFPDFADNSEAAWGLYLLNTAMIVIFGSNLVMYILAVLFVNSFGVFMGAFPLSQASFSGILGMGIMIIFLLLRKKD